MSYLDPIQTALDKSSPIPHGGLKAIAQLFGIVSIPISIYVFARASQSGWDNLPWPVVLGVILLLMAGFGAICTALLLFALLLQGVPETLTVIQENFSDYYRRNVVGHALVLIHENNAMTPHVVLNNQLPHRMIGRDRWVLPLAGWNQRAHFVSGFNHLPWRIRVESISPGSTEPVYIKVRLNDGNAFSGTPEAFYQLLCNASSDRLPPNLGWDTVLRYLQRIADTETAMVRRADQESIRANELMSLHLGLLRKIGDTKRLQHSKEGERLRLEAMERIPSLFPENHPTRREFEDEIARLMQRIARREGVRVN